MWQRWIFSQAGEPSVSPQDEDQPMNPDDTLQASEEFEAEGEEAVPARGLPSPSQPTRAEIQERVLTHLPPRSWIGHCLRGRGTSLPHVRRKTEEEHVIDYFFMGPSGQQEAQGVLPTPAVKSHKSRMAFARVVERKGPVDSTVRRLVADLDGWDCGDLCTIWTRSQRVSLSSKLFANRCPQLNS